MLAKRNETTSALIAFMANEKAFDDQTKTEWEMSTNNTDTKKGYRTWNHAELKELYPRDTDVNGNRDWRRQGATKNTHIVCHTKKNFQYIVVKRHRTGGYIDEHHYNPEPGKTGNQLIDEIYCWERFADQHESDFLCPILKYFKSKSDKVSAVSEKMQENILIIAQRACQVGTLAQMCKKAAEMNNDSEDSADDRYNEMLSFSKRQGWCDVIWNDGNSGVIYDYAQHKYKAVFIDYAL